MQLKSFPPRRPMTAVRGDLIRILKNLLKRDGPRFDAVVIETTGAQLNVWRQQPPAIYQKPSSARWREIWSFVSC